MVDGDVRIPIDAGAVLLLGRSGDDYVVATANKQYTSRFRVHRYTASGDRTLLLRDLPIYELTLSDDGDQIAYSRSGDARTKLRVFDSEDGTQLAGRRFRGYLSVLDGDGGRWVLGGWSPTRTLAWDPVADTTEEISGRAGYAADVSADRLAVMTRDPYLDGCSVVSTLTTPDERLWRSCHRRVDTFSPHRRPAGDHPHPLRRHRPQRRLAARGHRATRSPTTAPAGSACSTGSPTTPCSSTPTGRPRRPRCAARWPTASEPRPCGRPRASSGRWCGRPGGRRPRH